MTTAEPDMVLMDVDEHGVATLTLNRPEARNGFVPEMERRWAERLDEVDSDPAVRAVIVTGAGTTFSPGLDAKRMAAVSGSAVDLTARPAYFRARALRKPVVAAINGACAGMALVLALNCDVRFASRTARFSTAFARRGLAAEYNIAWLLPRYVGVENALDLLLSARTIEAEEAQRLGLVSRVCEPDELLAAATEYARDIARNCAPRAMATIRAQVYADLDADFETAYYRCFKAMAGLSGSPDFIEGAKSFAEKRAPDFGPIDDYSPTGLLGVEAPGARITGADLHRGLS